MHPFSGITAPACQLWPESKGSIEIISADSQFYPKTIPNYFSVPLDQYTAVAAMRYTHGLIKTNALSRYIATEKTQLTSPRARNSCLMLRVTFRKRFSIRRVRVRLGAMKTLLSLSD